MAQDETPDSGLRTALANLESILVKDEVVQAWAAQRRLFALFHRRRLVAATNNRLVALIRGPVGGFEYQDLRWQDLKEAHVSVGIFGATLKLVAEPSADLASAQSANRDLTFTPAAKWGVALGVNYLASDYLDINFLAGEARRDQYRTFNGIISYLISRNLSIRAEALVARNSSNIDLYAFQREVFTLKMRYEFK